MVYSLSLIPCICNEELRMYYNEAEFYIRVPIRLLFLLIKNLIRVFFLISI